MNFNFQKAHTSHPTHCPTSQERTPGSRGLLNVRFAGARRPPALPTRNSTGVTKAAQLLCPFLSAGPAFAMKPLTGRGGWGRSLSRWAEAGETGARAPHLPLARSQHLRLIHGEPRPLIRTRQPGTSTHPHWPHLPPRAGLCLWLQTGCRKWGAREGWGATGPRDTARGLPPDAA